MTGPRANDLAEADEGREKLCPEEWIIASTLAIMVITLFSQIVARFVFNASFVWSEELSRYLFVWLVFLGLGAVTLRHEHIVVDALTEKFPAAVRRALLQGSYVLLLLINVLLIVAAARMVYLLFDLGQESPALALPMWLVYLSLPVGLTVTSLRLVQASIRMWSSPERGEK